MATTTTQRLNWIDWAKAIAITFVVFGHIPEERGSFLVNYIVQFHMPLFFFISGYLTKKEYFGKATMTKYWHTLIVPYLCYNILFYPYWVVRHLIDCPDAGWYDFVKPIIGTLLLQHETPYFESLNGVTWFIAALLVMKVIFALCNRLKHGNRVIVALATACAVFHVFNDQLRFITDLPPVGFTKCLPFFFLGYLCKSKGILPIARQKNDLLLGALCIGISLLIYYVGRGFQGGVALYALIFWGICTTAIWGFFCICRLLDAIRSNIIFNISIGTIVILGLHWMLIGCANFGFSKLFHIQSGITYPYSAAILLSLLIVALLYPVILLFKQKFPFMLGKTDPSRLKNKTA